MTASTLKRISDLLPTLSADEQENVLDYIDLLRGKSVLADLSDEDRVELQRRASTIDDSSVVPLDDAIGNARSRLARREQ